MKKTILTLAIAITSIALYAQVKISTGGGNPDASSMLDVESTNKGLLPPRMTTAQRNAIASPAEGLMIYNTDLKCVQYNKGTSANPNWICSDGTNESNPPFICGTSTITDIDNNTYNTVLIGTQCWTVQNLKTTKYADNSIITNITTPNNTWESATYGAWSHYDNSSSNNATYGKLYNWYAVEDSRNICPVGWHVPSNSEWTTLTNYLGGIAVAGGKMKTTGTSHWNNPNTGATNSSGFTGYPGGYRASDGNFGTMRQHGYWWSATGSSATQAYFWRLDDDKPDILNGTNLPKTFGISVRCIKD
jgi:uncharacterized protein (TIGR02145 family)